ncbi:I78 family peptidase inhibitor [Pseudomonas sp. zfem002]|uniref:I78 family peptidase inhibitor n=1 Tax=Pseudomonas sp. zfem002 TaxID=3078197 RepID=UPI002927F917|nr:I78 family peptidase inhibitor [Pseudomonas sp. zfem002]MDU9392662.1 I78 family peptidase inhibitor [Pseudomonas sp. zfem002]
MTNDEVQVALAELIGCEYTPALKARITELTGRARVVGPTDVSTMDLDHSRIHVVAGGNGVITGFRFG